MMKQYVGIWLSVVCIAQPVMAGHIELLGWMDGERQDVEWNSRIFMPLKQGKAQLSFVSQEVLSGKQKQVSDAIIKKPADVLKPDMHGVTPIHYAAAKGDPVIITLLLSKGADVNAQDKYGRTPLHWAVYYGNQSAVDVLIEAKNIDINKMDNIGRSALFWAVRKLKYKIVEVLLKAGADPLVTDAAGNSLLHYAASTRYVLRGEKMGYRDMPNAPDFSIEETAGIAVGSALAVPTALLAVNYAMTVMTALSKAQAAQAALSGANTALVSAQAAWNAAVAAGTLPSIAVLDSLAAAQSALTAGQFAAGLTHGALASALVPGPWTIAMIVITILITVIMEEMDEIKKLSDKEQRPEVDRRRNHIIKALIAKGADVNAANSEGKTPLHVAAIMKNHGVVKDLIEGAIEKRKANKDEVDLQGNTVMHYAVIGGAEDVAHYVLANTDLADVANASGITPLMVALQLGREQIARMLVNKGAKKEVANDGTTLLHFAAIGDKKVLLDMVHNKFPKIEIDARTVNTQQTALHMAAALSNGTSQYLINQGADKEAADIDGWTPLHFAANAGKEELVEYLINHTKGKDEKEVYASMVTNDNDPELAGKTAMDLARDAGWPGIVKFLAPYSGLKGKEHKQERKELRQEALEEKDERRSDRRYAEKRSPSSKQRMEKWERKSERKGEVLQDPMIEAAKKGRQNVVETLTKQGSSVVGVEEGTGRTALMYAVEKGQESMADMILDAAKKQGVQKILVQMKDAQGKVARDLSKNEKMKHTLSKIMLAKE